VQSSVAEYVQVFEGEILYGPTGVVPFSTGVFHSMPAEMKMKRISGFVDG
jgi:hypothetical protein